MPLFYFDYNGGDGMGEVLDDIGTNLVDLREARVEAARTMTELASDTISGNAERHLTMIVRDQSGTSRLRLSLVFQIQNIG